MTNISTYLDKLREWGDRHAPDYFETTDDWINSLSNVELLEALCWIDD